MTTDSIPVFGFSPGPFEMMLLAGIALLLLGIAVVAGGVLVVCWTRLPAVMRCLRIASFKNGSRDIDEGSQERFSQSSGTE